MKKVIIDGRRFVTDTEFRLAINEALEHMTTVELADWFSVSTPGILRWATGNNIPLASMRAHYVTILEDEGIIK